MERWGIPEPAGTRIAVRITPAAARHVRAGHPWLFESAITSLSRPGAAGDLAVVFDNDRRFMAIGLLDPASHIRVRLLHAGRPVTIDEAFWAERIDAALALRSSLDAEGTTGYRVLHGENDGVGGLVVDRYGDVLVVKVYSEAWFPHLPVVVEMLRRRLHPSSIVLRVSRVLAREGRCHGFEEPTALVGVLPDAPVHFSEAGLEFTADVVAGQKTGHFLDQRDNRRRVGRRASGARVLDVFSCTGGFSVHAAAGGARSVLSVDLSPHALAAARANMALNTSRPAVASCEHTTRTGDAFEVMRDLAAQGEQFDIVVVDPPSFAHRAADTDRALRAYGTLAALAMSLVRTGGTLVQSSCSSRVTGDELEQVVVDAAFRSQHRVRVVERTGHAVDHPVTYAEGEYLATVFCEVRR